MKVKDKRLTLNSAQCLKCLDTPVSTHRHDFRHCKCGEIFVDGGLAYARAGAGSFDNFKDLCEYEEYERDEYSWETQRRLEEEAKHERGYN